MFRFAARYGLLTYPQCGDLDPWAIVEMLGRLGAECIVGRESHQDGGVHLHAFFMFESKFESRNVRIFDVDGMHPNVVRGYSTPEKGYAYAVKDGDVVAGGLGMESIRRPVSESRSVWDEIVLAGSREEFFEACARLAPRALCCSFTSLNCYADWKYRPEPVPYEHPGNVSLSTANFPELAAWVSHNLEGLEHPGKRRSLVLYGPTRLGKTLWARSLGRHAYFGGLFSLDEDVSDVDYAVFDDMQGGIKFFHSYKFWLGAQSQFYATDKYKGKRLIDWGKPSIYISNNNPLEDEGVDHDWMLGNCDFVEITESLLVPEESGFRSEG
ncbi:replication associated protein [Gopherus associated genomovirus 1]|uniref:Replication-associated protein n=1 Tax=Gopherus associated genomovirus 1 TaxID=2041417 RepID=A0A384WTG2_9VIRU|nr:replication associated protein [Gopherus associated genomovirus 1]